MPNAVVQLLILLTILLLLASIWSIHRIRNIIQQHRLRTAWLGLAGTLFLAAFGCVLFLRTNDIEGDAHHEDWLIALTLLAAAIFVCGVCAVSLFTASELARIESLEKAAFFDPMTNLYTRGHIDSLLAVECKRSMSETAQLSLMLVEIDDFKFINDCFGHRAGDFVLREVARTLKQTVGPLDLTGRYGGEEFLIVAPNTSPFLAGEGAERIRARVAAAHLEFEGNDISITVSIGIKTNFTFREEAEDLVAAADAAMYEAKRRGRNRVVAADDHHLGAAVLKLTGLPGSLGTVDEI